MSTSPARSQWIAVAAIVAVLGGALAAGVALTEDTHRVAPGEAAPDFRAAHLGTGDTVSLAHYRGEVVLLNLWATWCGPCRVEMPSMERLYQELGPEGLKIVAVSVDQRNPEHVTEFTDELKLTFDILQDRSGRIEVDYQITGLPETLILDRTGTIVHKEIGPVEWDEEEQKARFRRLLAAPRPATVAARAR